MSDAKQPPKVTDAPERPKHGPQVRGHGPMGGMGVQEKAINFGPSLRRLLGTLRPERPRIIAVMVLTSIAVVANVVQPKILGSMTDLLFTGLLGAMIGRGVPAGTSLEAVVAGLRARGQDTFADMLQGMSVVPASVQASVW